MGSARLSDVGLLVLDEVHYLGDPGRGTVWEEVIISCLPHMRLLAMSATIANARQLGGWISQVSLQTDLFREHAQLGCSEAGLRLGRAAARGGCSLGDVLHGIWGMPAWAARLIVCLGICCMSLPAYAEGVYVDMQRAGPGHAGHAAL